MTYAYNPSDRFSALTGEPASSTWPLLNGALASQPRLKDGPAVLRRPLLITDHESRTLHFAPLPRCRVTIPGVMKRWSLPSLPSVAFRNMNAFRIGLGHLLVWRLRNAALNVLDPGHSIGWIVPGSVLSPFVRPPSVPMNLKSVDREEHVCDVLEKLYKVSTSI